MLEHVDSVKDVLGVGVAGVFLVLIGAFGAGVCYVQANRETLSELHRNNRRPDAPGSNPS